MESNQSSDARRHQLYLPVPRSPSSVADSVSLHLKTLVQKLMKRVGPELATKFQVDVPFLLQQAQFLYEKQLEELQLQMQRVNSSTSVLGQSKGITPSIHRPISRLR
jgi:hypothetical protein